MKAFACAAVFAALLIGVPAADAQAPPPQVHVQQVQAQPAQPIPYRKDDDAAGLALKVGIGLIVSIGLGVGALFVLRRYLSRMQRAPGKRLRVLESVRLTPKSALFLVEVDRRTLLIGQQGETLAVLAQSDARSIDAPPPPPAAGARPVDAPLPADAPFAADAAPPPHA